MPPIKTWYPYHTSKETMLSIKLRHHTILKNVGWPLTVYIKQNYVQNISITIKLSELSLSLNYVHGSLFVKLL